MKRNEAIATTKKNYTYLDERDSPMKTSLSALTGKRCGPETSDPADIEKNHVKSWLQSLDFQK